MEYTRMSTKDMLQYCNEALAWEEFGPVDIFFFESVKRILLGQCSAVEMTTESEEPDDFAEVHVPITAEEILNYEQTSEQLGEAIEGETFFEFGTSDYVMTDAEPEKNNSPEDGKEEADA